MFAHLNLHTEYSLLDGACRIKPLMERLKELGMRSCAITDHGTMYGVLEFYRAAKAEGIHPVIGCEVYVCADMEDKHTRAHECGRMVLLCENQTGYQNLCALVSESSLRGNFYGPRVDYALLEKYRGGLIALSGGPSSDIAKLLLDGKESEARAILWGLSGMFGRDHFYVELQNHGLPEQEQLLPKLTQLARELDIPAVCTNDCHYIDRDDAQMQEVLERIGAMNRFEDAERARGDQRYVKSEAEMLEIFPDCREAIERTEEIAGRCQVEFDLSSLHLPKFPLPEGKLDSFEYLKELCDQGVERLYGPDRADAWERLDRELSVIRDKGCADCFLIAWDVIRYAENHGVLTGPGLGSAASSIVAYALGITKLDPLKYNLLFECFLDPERNLLPDLYLEFDEVGREKMFDYLKERYGADRVARISAIGTMHAKHALHRVGQVMDLEWEQIDAISKLLPDSPGITLDRAIETVPELRIACECDEQTRRVVDMARRLEKMPRTSGTHFAGIAIAPEPLVNYMPLQWQGTREEIATQFSGTEVKELGLMRLDFLGTHSLNVIRDTEGMVADGALRFEAGDIPLDDPAVYEMLSAGDTDGVILMNSEGMQALLWDARPGCLEDIAALLALYRPGLIERIPRYLEGKRDPGSVRYLVPELKSILEETYGCLVYQEQMAQIMRDLAGFPVSRALRARRFMQRRREDAVASEREAFIHGLEENGEIAIPGCVRRGIPEELAGRIFDELTAIAGFATNKAYSMSRAVLAVQAAYVKRRCPVEFMVARLNASAVYSRDCVDCLRSMRRQGIPLLPPDMGAPENHFSVGWQDGKKGVRLGVEAAGVLPQEVLAELMAEDD